MKTLSLVVLIWMALLNSAQATSVADRTVAELYRESVYVVQGSIDRVEGVCESLSCMTKYTVKLQKIFKSRNEDKAIFVCSTQPLALGETYTLFVGSNAGDAGEAELCNLILLVDGVFIAEASGRYYRYMSLDGLNRSVVLDGRKFLTYLVEEPEFEEELRLVAKGSDGRFEESR